MEIQLEIINKRFNDINLFRNPSLNNAEKNIKENIEENIEVISER